MNGRAAAYRVPSDEEPVVRISLCMIVRDEEELLPTDRDVLQQVATCLTTGPLHGKAVQLVGRSDPRGTDEYNLGLGSRRARAVSDYLARLGVPSTQLATKTKMLGGIPPARMHALMNAIVAQVSEVLLANSVQPPVIVSMNVPNGDERNRELQAKYGPRLQLFKG